MYVEAALTEYLLSLGAFVPQCYGLFDEYTAIFELILIPGPMVYFVTLTKAFAFALAANKQTVTMAL